VAVAVAADQMMVEPARFVARTIGATGQPAYEYRFSYVAESMRKKWPGRAARYRDPVRLRHGGGAIRQGPDGCGPGHGASGQRVLGELRQDGQSERKGLPEWPAYSPKTDILMDFSPSGPVAKPDP
jgi:para-nitrobenzyl esterase